MFMPPGNFIALDLSFRSAESLSPILAFITRKCKGSAGHSLAPRRRVISQGSGEAMTRYVIKRGEGAPDRLARYRAELNEEQFAVATAPPGAALVVAGAGSGKTRAITYRVAYLVEPGVSPARILLR